MKSLEHSLPGFSTEVKLIGPGIKEINLGAFICRRWVRWVRWTSPVLGGNLSDPAGIKAYRSHDVLNSAHRPQSKKLRNFEEFKKK